MKRIFFVLISAIFILAACSPTATNTPGIDTPTSSDEPTATLRSPADSNQQRGNVYLDSTELLTMESYPLQFSLTLKGCLPTPCNKLKVSVSPPDAQNKIAVDVYSMVDPNILCAEVLQPFEENIPLGSFPAGHYTLWTNGKQIAEFDA